MGNALLCFLDGILTVLSGMSNLEQVLDNTEYMSDFRPLTDSEREVIAEVVEALNSIPTIPAQTAAIASTTAHRR